MRSDWRPLAAITIGAVLIRLATIDVQSYWFDEALSAKLVSSPFGTMLRLIPQGELTPPLYYVLAWPWAHVIGMHELALRSLSALFGIATVPVAYLAGRELVSHTAGLVAATLAAFNPLLVWYSQEARPYALLVLLTALSLLFCARALRRRRVREVWLWAATSALALLTHYFAAFLVVPEGLWIVWAWRTRSTVAAGLAVAGVGAALIPLAAYERSRIGTGYIAGLPLSRRALGVPEDYLTGFVIKFDTAPEKLLDALALTVAGVAAWLAFTRTNATERRGALVAACAVAAAAAVPALLALAGADFLNTRNVIAGAVPALLVLGAGFGAARTGRALRSVGVAALCLVGIASVALVAADSTFHRENWRGIAQALGSPDGGRVLVVPPASGELGLGVQIGDLARVPASGATVSEVAVATPRSTRLGGERSARPDHPKPPGAGFRLADRRYESDFTLLRWVSPTPVRLSPAALAASGRGVVPAPVLLLQPRNG